MATNLTIPQLIEAIIEKKQPEAINEYAKVLADQIEEASKLPLFYSLPIKIISSIINKAAFYEEKDPTTLINDIADKTSKVHDKEAILLLNDFYAENLPPLVIDNIIDISSHFKSSQLLTKLSALQGKEMCTSYIDDDLKIKQLNQILTKKKQENAELRRQIEKKVLIKFPPIIRKPHDFESDMEKAINEGKFASVQYLIEVEGVDKEEIKYRDYTPFFLACAEGRLKIVQYLCERQNVNKEAKNKGGWTPFYIACHNGQLEVVKYLCEKQNINKEATTNSGCTPFYAACSSGRIEVVQYLCERQNINKEAHNNYGWTPFYVATNDVKRYLKSIGVTH